jgi:preprotein translocase subunit SecG
VQIAFYIALVVISIALITVVVLQARSAGMQSRDTSSVYRTRRGLEKTLHQTTVVLATVFLLLSLVASLPLFGSPATPATAPGQAPGQPGIPGQAPGQPVVPAPAPGQAPGQPVVPAPAPAPGGFVGDGAI